MEFTETSRELDDVGTVLRHSARFNLAHSILANLRVATRAEYYRTEILESAAATDAPEPTTVNHTASATATLDWDIGRDLKLATSYRYRWQSNALRQSVGESLSENSVTVQLSRRITF